MDSQASCSLRGNRSPKSSPYRSISSRSGVASPAMDMGVLSIMGLGEGRGVSRCFCFLRSASFSCSHCSAIFPQSIAAWLLDLGGEIDGLGGWYSGACKASALRNQCLNL